MGCCRIEQGSIVIRNMSCESNSNRYYFDRPIRGELKGNRSTIIMLLPRFFKKPFSGWNNVQLEISYKYILSSLSFTRCRCHLLVQSSDSKKKELQDSKLSLNELQSPARFEPRFQEWLYFVPATISNLVRNVNDIPLCDWCLQNCGALNQDVPPKQKIIMSLSR